MHLGNCHTETLHDSKFLWAKEGFYCLVPEKGCMVHMVKKEMTLQQMIFKLSTPQRDQ